MYGSIIVIDDDDDILDGIVEYLNIKEFNVVGTGHNGLEAVQLYEEYRPDLVLMDITMPNYDGIYGIEHILRINSNAKVIVLTGNLDETIEQKIKPFNVAKVLQKPCSLRELEQVLKSINIVNNSLLDNGNNGNSSLEGKGKNNNFL